MAATLLGLGPSACAPEPVAPPPAAPAAPEPAPSVTPAPQPEPVAQPEAPAEPAPSPPEPEPAPEPAHPTKPATEILTDSDTDFLFDYPASDLKEAAQTKCQGLETPQATAECLQKARDEFAGDVMTFKKAGEAVTLTVYRRRASRLEEVYSVPVQLVDSTPSSVTVKTKSNGKGARPFLAGQREFQLEVPDDYSLVVTDPKFGRLTYRAKYGLVDR